MAQNILQCSQCYFDKTIIMAQNILQWYNICYTVRDYVIEQNMFISVEFDLFTVIELTILSLSVYIFFERYIQYYKMICLQLQRCISIDLD